MKPSIVEGSVPNANSLLSPTAIRGDDPSEVDNSVSVVVSVCKGVDPESPDLKLCCYEMSGYAPATGTLRSDESAERPECSCRPLHECRRTMNVRM